MFVSDATDFEICGLLKNTKIHQLHFKGYFMAKNSFVVEIIFNNNPIFPIHVNWIVFYLTAHLFKFSYQQKFCKMLRSNESWSWCYNSLWLWKMIIDETRAVQKSVEDIPSNNCFKILRATCCAIQFL